MVLGRKFNVIKGFIRVIIVYNNIFKFVEVNLLIGVLVVEEVKFVLSIFINDDIIGGKSVIINVNNWIIFIIKIVCCYWFVFFFDFFIILVVVFFGMFVLVECGFRIWEFDVGLILFVLFKVELRVVVLRGSVIRRRLRGIMYRFIDINLFGL